MLLPRLCWLLPALIASWTNLRSGAALPAQVERNSRATASTFDSSTATSTIYQDHGKRAYSPDGKNVTQSSHKLVASPAGLLRPDKFQFYTYNDKGDMITRQMTVEEIQGLIAAGGADHVAMDRQEPQKADDIHADGKKVMDVVQKVQNVLKSALDKPPTLTGSMPKIPEHANVEWSNILPSILSGEADAIPPSGEPTGQPPAQPPYKLTTERSKVGSGAAEHASPTEGANIGTGVTTSNESKRKPVIQSDVQTNAYAGFANNAEHGEKPQHSRPTQQVAPTIGSFSEKPMIPVPVITLMEQKLSTLQSHVTESPIFQMLSVIPVEAGGGIHHKNDQAVSFATTELSTLSDDSFSSTGQLVELTLSERPVYSTSSQSVSTITRPTGVTKKPAASLGDKIGEKVSAGIYATVTPSIPTASVTVDTRSTVTYGASDGASSTDKISSSSTSYVLIQSENDTELPARISSHVPGVTQESVGVTGTHYDDRVVPQANASRPPPHTSATPKPAEASHASTAPTSPQTIYLDEGSSSVTEKLSGDSVTPVHTDHRNSQPAEIQSPTQMEPQLIDSFSSVMSQISEARPSVLSLSPASSSEKSEISIASMNYDQRRNVSDDLAKITNTPQYSTFKDTSKYVERTKSPSQVDATTRIAEHSTTQRTTTTTTSKGSIKNAGSSNVPKKPLASTTTKATDQGVIAEMANNLATTISGLSSAESTYTLISMLTTSSPAWIQLEKIRNASLEHQTASTGATSPEITTASSASTGTDGATALEKISSVTSTESNAAKVQSSAATDGSSSKTTPAHRDDTQASVSWSDPISAIDQVLSVAPRPSSTPSVEAINLPNDTSSFAANGLASGLIAGFATSTSKRPLFEGGDKNQAIENASVQVTASTTKLTDSTKNVTQTREEPARFNATDEHQTRRNVTQVQASTQGPLSAHSTESSSLKLNAQTDSKSSEETTKLPGNERVNSSANAPSVSSPNKLASNGSSDDSVGQSTVNADNVIASPDRSSTTEINAQSSSDKTLSDMINYNQNKKDDREKTKTTEAPLVRTSPGSSKLPVASIDSTNKDKTSTWAHAESSNEVKGGSVANASSLAAHKQDSPATRPVGDHLTTELHASQQHRKNVTTSSQGANRTNNATTPNKTGPVATSKTPYTSTDRTESFSTASSSMTVEDAITESSIKIVTQKLSGDTSEKNKNSSRPRPTSGTGSSISANNTSHLSNKNAQAASGNASTSQSLMKNTSNSTENELVSLKHFESTSKPEVALSQSSTPSNVPDRQVPRPAVNHKFSEKPDILKTDADVNTEDKWTLISQQTPSSMTRLPKPPRLPKPSRKPVQTSTSSSESESANIRTPGAEAATHHRDPALHSVLPLDASQGANGLDVTVKHTSADIVNFAKLCNELAFNFWVATNKGLSTARSLALSPFGMTSLLAMIFLGARGPTSDQMNEVLGLDDVATFNPHLVFQNITDTVSLARGQGIANAAFVRELFADKMKVRKLMPFYKEQAQQFYEGLVTEVNFATISDLVRRRTNLLVRKQTGGRIKDFVKTNTVPLRSPLAALSANVFQTDCNTTLTSSIGRDGELYFAVSPAVRQRRLVPVPATTWRLGVLAGYEPSIDATAVALGGGDRLVSTIFLLPGQQGHTAPGDTLDRLEQRLVRSAFRDGTWNKLLKILIPRSSLELQVPKFSHRSVINATAALKRLGLDELFSGNADFKGINGVGHRLHLADVLQMNLFSTCGDENILSGRHHVETYPASPLRSIRRRVEDADDAAEDDTLKQRDDVLPQEDYISSLPANEFQREEKQLSATPERPRLKLDRPFLYLVRHNPSGMILHMGRFNPRLLP